MVELWKNNEMISTNAIYGDDIKVLIERASGEMYRRTKINGSFCFLNEDFDAIYLESLDTQFRLVIKENNAIVAEGVFYKTDCTFDIDNKRCDVSVSQSDVYDKIVDGKNNKYNLVSLNPRLEQVKMLKRPIMQFYMLGDRKVTNVLGNMSYEVDATEINDKQSILDLGFGAIKMWRIYHIETQQYPTLNGDYFGYMDTDNYLNSRFIRTSGNYVAIKPVGEYSGASKFIYQFVDMNGNDMGGGATLFSWGNSIDPDEIFVSSIGYTAIYGSTKTQRRYVFGRLIHNDEGTEDMKIPSNDLVASNLNYRFCEPIESTNEYPVADCVIVDFGRTTTPNKYGLTQYGDYFRIPMDNANIILPIAFNMWHPMSFWLNVSNLEYVIPSASVRTTSFNVNHAIPLGEAIRTLLGEIDPNIRFEDTTEYSEFLYRGVNIFNGARMNLYITPITNIKKTYYNTPAQRGDITLNDIFNMLRSCFQCYWFIDSEKRLRIEHILWFKNGGGYTPQARLPLEDLTAIRSPKLGKTWAFEQNKVKYEKPNLPSRYEFSWGDNATEPFNGYAIDIQDGYVSSNNIEKVSVANFLSDIDYIIGNPTAMSDDLYALICARPNGNTKETWITDIQIRDNMPPYRMQNGVLSFLAMANINKGNFWRYNLSGELAYIADLDTYLDVKSTMPIVRKQVTYPCTIQNYKEEGIIRTEMGDEELVNMSFDLDSKMATATLEQTESGTINIDYIVLSEDEISFESEGGVKQIVVRSSSDWYVSNLPTWLMVDKYFGKDGDIITITCEPSTSDKRKRATLDFHCGDIQTTLVVNVSAFVQHTISLSPTSGFIRWEYGVYSVSTSVVSSTDWGIESCPSWVHPSAMQGKSGDVVEFTADTPVAFSRIGYVVFKAKNATATYEISQSRLVDAISCSPSSINVPINGGTYDLTITCGPSSIRWKIGDLPSWITANKTSGASGESVRLTISGNMGSRRWVNVGFVGNSSIAPIATCAINQDGYVPVNMSFNPERISVDEEEQACSVRVSSNYAWEITNYPSWITDVYPMSANSGETTLTFIVSKNSTTSERSGNIIFWTDNPTQQAGIQFNVAQSALRYLYFEQESMDIYSTPENPYTINLYSSSVYQIQSRPDWLTFVGTPVGQTIQFNVTDNKTTETRTGTIVVTNQDGLTAVFTIYQHGEDRIQISGIGMFEADPNNPRRMYVVANGNWQIASKPNWISLISPSYGGATSGMYVNVYAEKNNGGARYGNIRAICGVAESTIQVGQESAGGQLVIYPYREFSFNREGGVENIQIVSDVEWVVSGGAKWVNLTTQVGDAGTTNTQIVVQPNTSRGTRTATLEFVSNGIVLETLEITQQGGWDF